MKFCEKCKLPIEKGNFCPKCGGRLIELVDNESIEHTVEILEDNPEQVYQEISEIFHEEVPVVKKKEASNNHRLLITLIVCLCLVIFLLIGVILFFVFGKKSDAEVSMEVPPVVAESDVDDDSQISPYQMIDEENDTDVDEEEVDEEEADDADESSYLDEEDDFIIPYSSSEILTKADLQGLSKEEVMIARNEIYARNGRKFKDAEIREYFESKDWYDGYIDPDDFTKEMLNEIEIKNINFIVDYEKSKGW